jgi:hypothetical protein
MTLEEELDAVQKKPGSKCSVCAWLETLAPEEKLEWDAAFRQSVSKFSHTSLYEVSKKHGAKVGRATISYHRRMEHRP